MADRDVAKAQTSAEITTSSGSAAALALTYTPASASKDYWLIWSSLIGFSSTFNRNLARVTDGTTTLASVDRKSKDSADRVSFSGWAKWTSPSTPASTTFEILYGAGGTGSAAISDRMLLFLESHADDEYAETLAEISTVGTTYQDAQELTFTPASPGEYLIMVYAEIASSDEDLALVKTTVDGADYAVCAGLTIETTSDYVPYLSSFVADFTAASHTIKLQINNLSSGRITYARRRRILAIRLDTLRLAEYAQTVGEQTTTSATAVDAASLSFTAEASTDYLFLGSGALYRNSTSASSKARMFLDGSVDVQNHSAETGSTTNTLRTPYMGMYYGQFSAGSRDAKTQFWGGSTTTIRTASMVVLDLREAAGGSSDVEIDVPLATLTLSGQAPSILLDKAIGVPAAALSLTGYAPGVAVDRLVDIPAAALSLTANAPTVAVDTLVAVPLANLTLTGHTPAILVDAAVSIPVASLTLTAYAPSVTQDTSVNIPLAALTIVGHAPAVVLDAVVNVPVAALALEAFAPVVDLGEAEENDVGGFLTPEQARAVIRKIRRTRSERARRAAEIDEAIQEAKALEAAGQPAAKAVQPVRRVIERDTGAIMLPALLSLQDALNKLALIDQQVAMLNTRRMDDAAAVLLLMEL